MISQYGEVSSLPLTPALSPRQRGEREHATHPSLFPLPQWGRGRISVIFLYPLSPNGGEG